MSRIAETCGRKIHAPPAPHGDHRLAHQKEYPMSIAEMERFAADLKSNEALRAEAEKHAAEGHHETPMAHCVSFAGNKGYAFTADEVKEFAKATAKAAGRELNDAELDSIAGGGGDSVDIDNFSFVTIFRR